jgi:uncharacterized protein YuzB (UPF0349 family)
VLDFLPVGSFIIVPDQAEHCSVVCKFDDVSVVNGGAVMGEEAEVISTQGFHFLGDRDNGGPSETCVN